MSFPEFPLDKLPKTLSHRDAVEEVLKLILSRCYRQNLLKDPCEVSDICSPQENLQAFISEFETQLVQKIIPGVTRFISKGWDKLFQLLYEIDIDEQAIKQRVLEIPHQEVPELIARAIIHRLKWRYFNYLFLEQEKTKL